MTSAAAMVSDSALKNAPVTPDRKASGRNTSKVAMLDPVSGGRNSRAGRQHGVIAPGRLADAAGAGPAREVLDHGDHVVDHQADRGRDAAQRHDVEASCPAKAAAAPWWPSVAGTTSMATSVTRKLRRKASSTSAASTSADQDRVAHAAGGVRHQRALIVPVGQRDAGRQLRLEGGERLAHRRRDGDGVAVRLLVDLELDSGLPVLAHPGPLRHRRHR